MEEFRFKDGSSSKKARFDAAGVPKRWGISPSVFNVEIVGCGALAVQGVGFDASSKDVQAIEELVRSLFYAAQGFKDCEMAPKRFAGLMGSFSNAAGSPGVDVKSAPRLSVKIFQR